MCGREAKGFGIWLALMIFLRYLFFLSEANFNFFGSFENPFRLDSVLRARIETRSSISESLQCSQRLCDAVQNPYCFYDYLQQKKPMADEHKEFSTWQQAQPHSLLFPEFPNHTSFNSPNQQSDFLQVLKKQPVLLLFSFLLLN